MKRYCLTLDLKEDPQLIAAYERHHREVWPEVLESIRESDILTMDIYRAGNRLCMILETEDSFSFEEQAIRDQGNPKVQAWESLMWKYQQPVPWARTGEKWYLMEPIFSLGTQQ